MLCVVVASVLLQLFVGFQELLGDPADLFKTVSSRKLPLPPLFPYFLSRKGGRRDRKDSDDDSDPSPAGGSGAATAPVRSAYIQVTHTHTHSWTDRI